MTQKKNYAKPKRVQVQFLVTEVTDQFALSNKMESISTNSGLLHLSEQIFGYLNHDTLEVCRKVSKHWRGFLERLSLIKYLQEFGDQKIKTGAEESVGGDEENSVRNSDIIPGWNKAVKNFVKTAGLEDLKEVKESIDRLFKGKNCSYPVHEAAANGSVKLMQLFFFTEYDFNKIMMETPPPFHFACMFEETDMVKLMILSSREFGIDLNAKSGTGNTIFHTVALNGKIESAKLMIQFSKEFDIDLNAKSGHGRTVLHDVACIGDVEMVELMIRSSKEYDISLNSQDYSGVTPFQHACEFARNGENLKMMINLSEEYDIDLGLMQIVDRTGMSRFQFLCAGGFKGGFYGMSNGDRVDIAKLVIKKRKELGINIYQRDYKGDTTLDELKYFQEEGIEPYDPDRLAGYSELIALLEEEY
eukprot:13195.XXX_429369_428113_1 [CDS] Oithona nana genome sequencing.